MELNATTAEVIAALCNAEVDIIALLANWLDHDLVWELFLDVMEVRHKIWNKGDSQHSEKQST